MDKLYSYHDYEEAYYRGQYGKCKTIGLYLLSLINNEHARKLYRNLSDLITDRELTNIEKEYWAEVLFDVKVWIMVNMPC